MSNNNHKNQRQQSPFINELSFTQFDEARRRTDLVIVPTGSVEVYGPHLPLGSDFLVAKAIAGRVARQTDSLVAPTLEVGEASNLLGASGTFTISRQVLENFLDEILAQLVDYGFRRFLFITGHAGNVDTVAYLSRKIERLHPVRCAQVDWWRFIQHIDDGIFDTSGYHCHGHAAEAGTSVVSYLYPPLADLSDLPHYELAKKAENFPEIIQYQLFVDKTDKGMTGDARAASPEKGRLLVERAVDRIVDFINTDFNNDER